MFLRKFLWAYVVRISKEFLPGLIAGVLVGMLFGAGSLLDLATYRVIEGVVVFFLLFNAGFLVNCWSDWRIDKVTKARLYRAVGAIGTRGLGWLVVAHVAAALLLTVHMWLSTGINEILYLVLVGTFIGIGYSVEPIRLKKRGVLHSLMAVAVFTIPGIFSYYFVSTISLADFKSVLFLLLMAGISASHYGLVLFSQSEDSPGEKAYNVRTPPVAWGLKKTMQVSLWLNVIGTVMIVLAFLLAFAMEAQFLVPYVAAIVAGKYLSFRHIIGLNKFSRLHPGDREMWKEIKKVSATYPYWHAYSLVPIVVGGLLLAAF